MSLQVGAESKRILRFGPFEVDCKAGELRKHGLRVKIREQPLRILEALISRPGELVTREELRLLLWPDGTFVDYEHGLNNALNRLRDVLSDDPEVPRFIETVPRRGYKFIAPVRVVMEGPPTPIPFPREPSPDDDSPSAMTPSASINPRHRSWTRLVVYLSAVAMVALLLTTVLLSRRLQAKKNLGSISPQFVIGVYPVENYTQDPDQQRFARAMTDAIVNSLLELGISAKRVPEPEPEKQSNGSKPEFSNVLKTLLVQDGQLLRISSQLTEVSRNRLVWSGTFERDPSKIPSLQHELVSAVALSINLKARAENSSRQHITVPEAYEHYVKGRFALDRRSREGFVEAQKEFEQAIAKDPSYAEAFAGLADSYNLLGLGQGDISPRTAAGLAKQAAQKSIDLDNSTAEAHAALAFTKLRYDWDWAGAEREFRVALQLQPQCPNAALWYSQMLTYLGRQHEAQELNANFRNTISSSLFWSTRVLGGSYLDAGDPSKAIKIYQHALQLAPDDVRLRIDLASIYSRTKQPMNAVMELKQAETLSPRNPYLWGELGYAYALAGATEQAEKMITELRRNGGEGYPSFAIAKIQITLDRRDEAMSSLEKAAAERCPQLPMLDLQLFRSLQSDPRFERLAAEVGLASVLKTDSTNR